MLCGFLISGLDNYPLVVSFSNSIIDIVIPINSIAIILETTIAHTIIIRFELII